MTNTTRPRDHRASTTISLLPSGSRNRRGWDGAAEVADLGVDVDASVFQLCVVGIDVVGLERDGRCPCPPAARQKAPPER